MAYEVSNLSPMSHRLQMEGRERLTVSGVEDVVRFDEGCIVMTTCVGSMVITGTDLHIGKLSLDGGEKSMILMRQQMFLIIIILFIISVQIPVLMLHLTFLLMISIV